MPEKSQNCRGMQIVSLAGTCAEELGLGELEGTRIGGTRMGGQRSLELQSALVVARDCWRPGCFADCTEE